jgi:7-cyano-7-deazaguanine synthase
MDSCVCAAIALGESRPAFLHVSYGQRTAARELDAFRAIADFYKVADRLEVQADHLGQIGGSSLTDTSRHVEDADSRGTGIPSTYVPFRNANLLAIAISWSEVIGAERVYIGAVEQDSSGYPDCRRSFFDAFSRAADLGTRPETRIEVCTPLIEISKSEIVRTGTELGAPLHLTWSCYVDSGTPCGRCDSCELRRRAFAEAGIADPVSCQSDAGAAGC